MQTAKSLLNRRFQKAFENLGQNQSDLLEQNRVAGLLGSEMSGGFANNAERRINYELGQDRADLMEQQKTETEILDLKEKEAKEAANKAKTGNLIKTIGNVVTAGASLINPVLGAGIGMLAQGANAMYGNTADFSTIDYDALSQMGGYFKRKKKFNNATFGTELNVTPQMEQG
jgi:hypothetical protein